MLQTRVIPILLMKKGGLYKGIKFKDHKYIGDPINTVKIFNDKEVDELVILDIESSKENRPIDFGLLKEIVSEAFMPIAYGGGIKTLDDAKKLFGLGIEKLVLNTHAIENTEFVKSLVAIFGSQSIVFSLDVKKDFWGRYKVYSKSGTQKVKTSPLEMAHLMEGLGVGEIIINSIDREGTMLGYDCEIINQISKNLRIPIVVSGGAKSMDDFVIAKKCGAHALAAGSMFVYHGPHRAVLISYPTHEKLCEIFKGN